jgi:hypothetical protein
MYRFLLMNPEEFSAKCMLERALRLARQSSTSAFKWHDVDYHLMMKLSEISQETRDLARRIMLGDLFGCLGIFSTEDLAFGGKLSKSDARSSLERAIGERLGSAHGLPVRRPNIAVHVIADVNKTERAISFRTDRGRRLEIGKSSRRILIGVFFTNRGLSMKDVRHEELRQRGVQEAVRQLLGSLTTGPVREHELYSEAALENVADGNR